MASNPSSENRALFWWVNLISKLKKRRGFMMKIKLELMTTAVLKGLSTGSRRLMGVLSPL